MIEQKAFEARFSFCDLTKYSDGSYAANFACCAYKGWQARGEYEAERVKKLIEALEYIRNRKWAARTPQAGSWINEFCDVAEKALNEYNKG